MPSTTKPKPEGSSFDRFGSPPMESIKVATTMRLSRLEMITVTSTLGFKGSDRQGVGRRAAKMSHLVSHLLSHGVQDVNPGREAKAIGASGNSL